MMEAATANAKKIIRRRSGWVAKTLGRGKRIIWKIIYFDVDGRRRKETTDASTRQLARRILAERENAVERARLQKLPRVRDLIAPPPAVTLRSFSEEYLKHIRAHCTPETARRNESHLKTYILPRLGTLALYEVTPGHVQRYADERLAGRGRQRGGNRTVVERRPKPATVRGELMTLSGLFREAVKSGLLDRNPVKLVKKPKVENEIVRYLDVEEEVRLLAFAPEPLRSAIIVSIHSGLREGELRNLTWANVRFGKGASDSFFVVRHTKSKRDRVIPMSETLYQTVQAIPRHVSSPYVFTNSDTATKFERFNADGWRAILGRAGVEDFRWHDLRHTFGSRLAQAGVSIIAIKELMGHSTITVTMRYAHLAPSNLRDAVRALDVFPQHAEVGTSATHSATQQPKRRSAAAG